MVRKRKDANAIIAFPFGILGIWTDAQGVSMIDLLGPRTREKTPNTKLAEKAALQLLRYVDDPEYIFSLPLNEAGTEFQKKVWQRLRGIPVGTTRQYGQLAAVLSSSPRAVGGACRSNPITIVTPCHRVVSRNGLGGYMGQQNGLPMRMKQWLLQHESGR